ncbi:ion transport 2 domain-containing protein [Fictibacillus macauensis ZFHKF-1]|uniref:Ion transport 2 domain-containing protein n=1 Tax=Fictibacillus macauensis ZFHKF-1 TaxID=1196324 RepID=I8IYU5_9BACL|nr:ion channel [Fictibacillus macauensis]EIT84651.1 ion transport 2 domain-containing protein [Fictibacillus macauensis ZFHKF-1]
MGSVIYVFIVLIAALIIFKSLQLLFLHPIIKLQLMSLEHLFVLVLVYITIILGFGLIYTSFMLMDIHVIEKGGVILSHFYFFHVLDDAMYFSSMTMLSVGYGDITPIGVGRWLSILEALIGYLLPVAFVLTSVIEKTSKRL